MTRVFLTLFVSTFAVLYATHSEANDVCRRAHADEQANLYASFRLLRELSEHNRKRIQADPDGFAEKSREDKIRYLHDYAACALHRRSLQAAENQKIARRSIVENCYNETISMSAGQTLESILYLDRNAVAICDSLGR